MRIRSIAWLFGLVALGTTLGVVSLARAQSGTHEAQAKCTDRLRSPILRPTTEHDFRRYCGGKISLF